MEADDLSAWVASSTGETVVTITRIASSPQFRLLIDLSVSARNGLRNVQTQISIRSFSLCDRVTALASARATNPRVATKNLPTRQSA